MKQWKKVCSLINMKTIAAFSFLMATFPGVTSFAFSTVNDGIVGNRESTNNGVSVHEWPWTKFLNSLMHELTGPTALILGILGVVGAAIALFSGHGGDGAKKFIVLIFAVSIAIMAPTLISWVGQDAGGFLLM